MTLKAVPEALPVTLPVNAPTNAVDVILVAPVISPASTLIVPSNTIAEPSAGVRLSAPVVELIVFASIVILSTDNAVSVPTDVICVCAASMSNVLPVFVIPVPAVI